MHKVIALIALCAATASALPFPVVRVELEAHAASRSSEMVLADEHVACTLAGPVAELAVEQTWRYEGHWFSPGDEAVEDLCTGHLSAFHDYWITEAGQVHRGVVRDRRSAVGEYRANLAARRDPGLVEWVNEGRYRMHLYPVPAGGEKKQGFRLLTVLPVRANGHMLLHWDLPLYRVARTTLRVQSAAGRVAQVGGEVPFTPTPDGALELTLTDLPAGWKSVDVELATDDVAGRTNSLAWRDDRAERLLVVTPAETRDPARPEFRAFVGPLAQAGALRAARILPAGLPDSPAIPADWLRRLEASARALRLELDDARLADAMDASRRAEQVGPEVVLFANPFATAERTAQGWADALKNPAGAAALPSTRPPERSGSWTSGIDFSVPDLVPNFRAARERSNFRACFANQKTVVGAIEMYNLDKNVKIEGASVHASWPRPSERLEGDRAPWALGAVAPALPAGIEESRWRERSRIALYRVSRDLADDPWHTPVVPAWYGPATTPGVPEIRLIQPQLWQALKEGGYLQSIPQDPGQGVDSCCNYVLTTFDNGIFCLVHGGINAGLGTPRVQLERAGIIDPDQLAIASPDPVPNRQPSSWPGLGWALVIAGAALLSSALNVLMLRSWPARNLERELVTAFYAAAKAGLWAIPAALIPGIALGLLVLCAFLAGRFVGASACLILRILVKNEPDA